MKKVKKDIPIIIFPEMLDILKDHDNGGDIIMLFGYFQFYNDYDTDILNEKDNIQEYFNWSEKRLLLAMKLLSELKLFSVEKETIKNRIGESSISLEGNFVSELSVKYE